MAIQVYEQRGQSGNLGEGGPEDITLKFLVSGTDDRSAAISAVLAQTTPKLIGYEQEIVRQALKADEAGYQLWTVEVPYKPFDPGQRKDDQDDPPSPFTYKLKFTTAGGTTKVNKSLKVLNSKTGDKCTAIGWDGKKLNGVEIVTPVFEFSLEITYPEGYINLEMVKLWARNTGKVNDAMWLNGVFEDREVLFKGVDGEMTRKMLSNKPTGPVPVTLHFAASENRENVEIEGNGQTLIVPFKDGWNYLDVKFQEQDIVLDGVTYTVPEPESFKTHRMYEVTNFYALTGIQ